MKQARWTNAVTFARFYKRPILQQRGSNFQDTVLRLRALVIEVPGEALKSLLFETSGLTT